MVLAEMTPLVLVLWREKHPDGKEQLCLKLPDETEQSVTQIGEHIRETLSVSSSRQVDRQLTD